MLGLDLEREATSAWEPTDEMRALMAERDAARAAKDFATADAMRDRLDAMGLEVMDTAEGTQGPPPRPAASRGYPSNGLPQPLDAIARGRLGEVVRSPRGRGARRSIPSISFKATAPSGSLNR